MNRRNKFVRLVVTLGLIAMTGLASGCTRGSSLKDSGPGTGAPDTPGGPSAPPPDDVRLLALHAFDAVIDNRTD